MAGSAGTIGALALGGAFGAQSVLADDEENETETGTETPEPMEEPMEEMFEDDVAILNYALTLEYLEAAFYRQALDTIAAEDVVVEWADELDESVRDRIYSELTVIKEHEETHVAFLTGVIEDLGEEPVAEPEFDFGAAVEDPATFVQTAAVLEDTGVAAYAGAAPSIQNADLVPPALSIHSVEACHASFVRSLGGMIGFPDAFDDALPKDAVLEAAGQFIVTETGMAEPAETATEDGHMTETATEDGHMTETATDEHMTETKTEDDC